VAWLLLWGGFLLILAVMLFPYPLFWAMWVGPLAIFSGQLIRKGIWNPFMAMAEGNWGPALLVAIGCLCNGFFWELWNWGSNANPALPATNPNYWIYDIPYVNVIHILPKCRCWATWVICRSAFWFGWCSSGSENCSVLIPGCSRAISTSAENFSINLT
jgi:hypothetical protein